MGMFAETSIINYRLSFANQGKQISVFCFGLQQTDFCFPFWFAANKRKFAVFLRFVANKRKLPFSVYKDILKRQHMYIQYIFEQQNFILDIQYVCWRFKRKTEMEGQGIFLNFFTVCSSWK
jgi:hypothetical protein